MVLDSRLEEEKRKTKGKRGIGEAGKHMEERREEIDVRRDRLEGHITLCESFNDRTISW